MKIPLDRQAKTPIYLQIRNRIGHLIHTGRLLPHAQLPSIRTLAHTVQVNKLTVLEAYSVLEADGLVRAKQGAGYFINPPEARVSAPQKPLLPSAFNPAQAVIIPTHSINDFPKIYAASLRSHTQPDCIDFGLGFPPPSGLEDLQRIARRAMKEAPTFFDLGHPQGDLNLRQHIAQILIQQGLEVSCENLIVTSGSMQSLSLLVEYWVQPGDWVVVEAPTYHGFLSSLQQRGAQIIGIPMTPQGMNLDLLAQYLASHRPKLIYTMSTLHNPTGITTSVEHRQKLLALAAQYDCLVIEDNAYEPLSFDVTPPPIKAFDSQAQVIYVGTFSKTLMPGLRVGYMAVTEHHRKALTERKLLHDFHVSAASQAIVKEYLASGHYRRRLNHMRILHRERRDIMLQGLSRYLPPAVTWTVPAGGTFLWLQLPDNFALSDICQAAAAQKVLVGSGAAFFPPQQGYPALRLNFALPAAETERGLQILGNILKSQAALQ
ncbi:MAG: PLP-dependent aminotransferase family protein [Phormidesmis sp. RL_2_1]|nr:PLP-dependent aminotransferase family protein [Phormidesmis sp. RL_2_1]